ncbi:protein translocase subunit SecD [Pseudohongiella sp. O18]|uniref:protein translocase subunit SecD n=1 Tax=Pseudohongiella sp. O18 TaxID=2904248 RepID=UPI001F018112|nr:protein translocase subunit SecD [Pseudohongiella sp. O18]
MTTSLHKRTLWYAFIIILGLLSALPNVLPESVSNSLPTAYQNNTVKLGLDLRGGSQLLLVVDTQEIYSDRDELSADALLDDVVNQSIEVIHRRLDETGMVEPSITRQGRDGILVQLPGVEDPQQVRSLLGTTAQMSFHWVAEPGNRNVMTLPDQADPAQNYRLERKVAMEGKHVRDARMAMQPQTNLPVVNFTLDQEGGRIFGDMTRQNVGRALAVVLDGEVVTAPVIRSPITGGSGEISGQFTAVEAGELAMLLRAGALPAALEIVEERTVGPNLGSDAISMGIVAGIFGAALVLVFMLCSYGSWGLIAWLGLGINMGLVFGILSLLGATLTLPGIAGLILVLGMAVDANILINERIRDEARQGKGAWLSLDNGFRRAYGTILDSNITTLIAISLLFMMGSGPIRGFAVTMGIGLLTSLFTAVAVNRVMMEWVVRRRARQALIIRGLPMLDKFGDQFSSGRRVIRFMKAGTTGLIVSAVLSIASLGLMAKPGLNYGIDFSGGALLEIRTPDTSIETLRTQLADAGLVDISVQALSGDREQSWLLRQAIHENIDGGSQMETLRGTVNSVLPEASIDRAELVGPRVSGDFTDMSILAVMLAGAGMLLYLWYRFENHFAMAAVLTIALDLTKTIGFFVLTGIEFNLTAIAALLALIGYSVNDKVVVFDRMRESMRARPDQPLEQIVNRSISATLTRTTYTSLSTLVAVLPMAVAGGSAVASFAVPMLFGIVVSTSSSIFIAAPIVLLLGRRRQRLGLPQLRPLESARTQLPHQV